MFLRFNNFYSPEDDATPAPAAPVSNDKDDIINFLGDDEPKDDAIDLTEKPKKTKEKAETDDEPDTTPIDAEEDEPDTEDEETDDETEDEDELAELIEEIEEPGKEKLELVTPVRRREILKKYPNIFKDFPYLETAYYREQKFTELLPTIEDAEEAVEKSQTLDRFEQDLMSGNSEQILTAVKEQSPNSFYKIIDNILPTIAKVDEKAYHHILGNTIKHTIVSMVQEAKKSNNEVLQSAAQILHQFVFGSSEFVPPSKLSKDEPKTEKDNTLSEREQAFNRRQFETTKSEVNTRINNTLKTTIDNNIDPKGSMSDYVKRNAVREVSETLDTLIRQDKRFGIIMDRLWDDAFKKGFSQESKDRILSAYRSKAKTLLPSVIKKARIEALRGMGKRVREQEDQPVKKGPVTPGKPRSSEKGGNKGKSGEVPQGMRTLDFLMQD